MYSRTNVCCTLGLLELVPTGEAQKQPMPRSVEAVLVASYGSTSFASVCAAGSVIHMAKFYVALDDSNISLSSSQN